MVAEQRPHVRRVGVHTPESRWSHTDDMDRVAVHFQRPAKDRCVIAKTLHQAITDDDRAGRAGGVAFPVVKEPSQLRRYSKEREVVIAHEVDRDTLRRFAATKTNIDGPCSSGEYDVQRIKFRVATTSGEGAIDMTVVKREA